MSRFFSTDTFIESAEIELTREESIHLARVMRLESGDRVELFDGKGKVAKAVIVDATPKGSIVRIESVSQSDVKSRIHIAFGLCKASALDFIIHRCTEIGVASLTPLLTQHSLHTKEWNEERWEKVVIEVCKQCQSNYLPEILQPIKLSEWLKKRETDRPLLFCDEAERNAPAIFLPENLGIDILVGAEGGWSAEERATIAASHAQAFSLGKNRLRAETATVVSLVLAKQKAGEL